MIYPLSELTIELTQKCFQGCLYCSSNSSFVDNIQLSFEIVKRVLDDFSFLGGKIVELSGGEPLSYEKIYETIDYALRKRLKVHLFTSAYLPNRRIDFDRLSKVTRFYINLQAPNSVIHDYLTGVLGSFDNVVGFVNECKSRGKWVGTHFVPLAHNIDEIDEYVRLAKHLKLDNISLLRFVEQGRGRKEVLSLNNDEILQLFSAIEKYRTDNSIEFKIGCPLDFGFIYRRNNSAVPCTSGISRCVIRPNGNVIPCPAFKDSVEFIAGNVNLDRLSHIWNKSPVFAVIRNFDYRKLRGLCAECHFLNICRGRCHAQRYESCGDLYEGPDPYCPLGINARKKLGDS